jgi:hypothetical protein
MGKNRKTNNLDARNRQYEGFLKGDPRKREAAGSDKAFHKPGSNKK